MVNDKENETANKINDQRSEPKKRKRGRPPGKTDGTRNWSDEETASLCNLWNQYENLYNTQHPMYYSRDARQKSLESIVNSLSESGITATIKQVTKKLTDLKTYYGAQRRMVESSKTSGAGTSDVFTSSWKFYETLSFLNDSFTPRETKSNASTYNTNNPPSNKAAKKNQRYK